MGKKTRISIATIIGAFASVGILLDDGDLVVLASGDWGQFLQRLFQRVQDTKRVIKALAVLVGLPLAIEIVGGMAMGMAGRTRPKEVVSTKTLAILPY